MDVVDAYDRVKGTVVANMAKLSAFDIVRRPAYVLRNLADIVCRNIDEFSIWIDEPADQPRARDAVNFRMLARDPFVFYRGALLPRW